jgi:hypothetical protein
VKESTIYVRLPGELRSVLEKEATNRGESLSVVVREALRNYAALHETAPAYHTAPTVNSSDAAANDAAALQVVTSSHVGKKRKV